MIDPRPILVGKKKAGREIIALMVLNGIPLEGQSHEAKDITKGDWITYWDRDLKRRQGQVYKVAPRKGWLRVRLDSGDLLETKQVLHKEKIEGFQVMTVFDHSIVEDLYDPDAVDEFGNPKLRPAHHVHDGYEQHHVRLKDHSKLKVTT